MIETKGGFFSLKYVTEPHTAIFGIVTDPNASATFPTGIRIVVDPIESASSSNKETKNWNDFKSIVLDNLGVTVNATHPSFSTVPSLTVTYALYDGSNRPLWNFDTQTPSDGSPGNVGTAFVIDFKNLDTLDKVLQLHRIIYFILTNRSRSGNSIADIHNTIDRFVTGTGLGLSQFETDDDSDLNVKSDGNEVRQYFKRIEFNIPTGVVQPAGLDLEPIINAYSGLNSESFIKRIITSTVSNYLNVNISLGSYTQWITMGLSDPAVTSPPPLQGYSGTDPLPFIHFSLSNNLAKSIQSNRILGILRSNLSYDPILLSEILLKLTAQDTSLTPI